MIKHCIPVESGVTMQRKKVFKVIAYFLTKTFRNLNNNIQLKTYLFYTS